MVTSHHEASHRIFQDRPKLLAPVFKILGLPPPEKATVEVLTADATEIRPLERRVDSVLRIDPSEGEGFVLAIEAQGRRDPDKEASWAYYLAYLTAKYERPALLLVVCHDKATADWAAGPFKLGPGYWAALSVHPLVVGPGNVPVITDPGEAAEDLTWAAFAAMTHSRGRNAAAILEALACALRTADPVSFAYYSELLEVGLADDQAREIWRKLMGVGSFFPGRGTLVEEKYLEGKADGVAAGLAEGKAEERARLVLRVLEKRGIPVPDAVRERLADCSDLDALDRWLDQAFIVSTAEELFAEGSC
ncbi:hypothetical protein ACWD4B_22265 [Streptomyces sp. NPDC002536]